MKPGVGVITPKPKTSGGARWSYLAAWGYALKKNNGDEKKAQDFVTRVYRNVPVLDSGARGSTTTFVQRGIGDVLLSWENEAFLALKSAAGKDKFEVVTPSISILAEPPVSIVDKVAAKRGTTEIAKAYLQFLYSEEGQEIGARNYYRPQSPQALEEVCAAVPENHALHDRRPLLADGKRRSRRSISRTAASSTKFILLGPSGTPGDL